MTKKQKKLKHRKYLQIETKTITSAMTFDKISRKLVHMITIEYVKDDIYRCHYETISGGDMILNIPIADTCFTRGQISENIRQKKWIPTDSAVIAAYLLAE